MAALKKEAPMAVKEKLDAAHVDLQMHATCFLFRARAQDGYWQLQEKIAELDKIVAEADFANVDAEIKAEGQAIRNIFNQAKAALDAHVEFLEWKQPVTAQKI